MEFAVDNKKERIRADKAVPKGEYYCPICNGRVIVKNQGMINRPHFAHKDLKDCDTWLHPMTPWHLAMQEKYDDEYREVVCDNGSEIHRADVLKDGVVIEFQYSDLPEREFIARNKFYKSLGYKVVWVFNVQEQRDNRQICWYNDMENGIYSWSWPKKMLRTVEKLRENDFALFFWFDDGHNKNTLHKVINSEKDEEGKYTVKVFQVSKEEYKISGKINQNELLINRKYESYKPYVIKKSKIKGYPRDSYVCPKTKEFGLKLYGLEGCQRCVYCAGMESNDSYSFAEGVDVYCCYPRVVDEDKAKPTAVEIEAKRRRDLVNTIRNSDPSLHNGNTIEEILKPYRLNETVAISNCVTGKEYLVSKYFVDQRTGSVFFSSMQIDISTGEIIETEDKNVVWETRDMNIWKVINV